MHAKSRVTPTPGSSVIRARQICLQFPTTFPYRSGCECIGITLRNVAPVRIQGNCPAPQLPEGKVAELVVESNREVIVSVTSEDSDFAGTNTIGSHSHNWRSDRVHAVVVLLTSMRQVSRPV